MTVPTHTQEQLIEMALDVSPSTGICAPGQVLSVLETLSDAIHKFVREARQIHHCAVTVKILTFAGDVVEETSGFESVETLHLPQLTIRDGGTNLGGALDKAMDDVEERYVLLRSTGVEAFKPWIIVFTDGMPNVNTAPRFEDRLKEMIKRRKVLLLPVAVGGYAAYPELERLSPNQPPIVIDPNDPDSTSFAEFFDFITRSIESGQDPTFLG